MAEKEFDFTGAKVAGVKQDEEIKEAEANAPKAKPKTKKELEKQIAEYGKVTAKIIAEARELAESKTGLNIEKFFTKHGLVNVDVEQLLNAPLKKDGTYA